jgi:hypothetical protein
LDDGKTYGKPRIRRGRKATGRRTPPKFRPSDPQTHRPRTQGRRTTRWRGRTENGANGREGRPFDTSEERSQQGRAQRNVGHREQAQRLISQRDRRGRNQAIRAVIGLGADLARMLAVRRDIIAVAMFDRDDTDRRPQEEGEAGEESGTGNGHSLQISSRLSEVKRASAFRACHGAGSQCWSLADQGVWPSLNHTDAKTAKNYRLNYQPFMSNGLTPCSAPKDLPCGE